MIKKEKTIFQTNWADRIFFVLLFLYLLLFIFQGIDFTDEGFYGVFYQQIFKNPDVVRYNFMFWFSGIIGGAFLHVFPWSGLLGLRFAAALTTLFTMMISYHLLRKYIDPTRVKMGLLLAAVIISNDPKSLFYDNLSALFFVIMICLLFEGLRQNKPTRIFLCGVMLSVNAFTKITNITGFALAAAILYYAIICRAPLRTIIRQILLFIGGFALTSALFLLIMKRIGHLPVFLDCLSIVKEMGKSRENSHGLLKLIRLFRYEYSHALIYSLILLLVIVVSTSLINKLKIKTEFVPIIRLVMGGCFIVFFLFMIKGLFIKWYLLLIAITGLALIAAILIAINPRQRSEIRLLAFLGATMTLVLPFGSDFGLYAVGRYALWVSLPLALNYYLDIQSFYPENLFGALPDNRRTAFLSFFSIRAKQLREIFKWSFAGFFLSFLYFAITNTWSDSKDRSKMIYPVNNQFMRGVFTTRIKASSINELLAETSKYVKKDDYLLAYDEIPLVYCMTQTRPFMHNSWPRLYDRAVFSSILTEELNQKKILPVVIYQKVESLDNNWPSVNGDNTKEDINQPKNLCIRQFLEQYHYQLVWENLAFRIYRPVP